MTDGSYEDFEDFMQDRLSNNDSSSAEQSPGGENSMPTPNGGDSECAEECGKIIIQDAGGVTINVNCCPDSTDYSDEA